MIDIVQRLRANVQWLTRDGFLTNAANTQEAADEIEALRQQLAASQAREAKLREACKGVVCAIFSNRLEAYKEIVAYLKDDCREALALSTDETALIEYGKQKQREALLEADKVLLEMQGGSVTYCNETIRRMAEALK